MKQGLVSRAVLAMIILILTVGSVFASGEAEGGTTAGQMKELQVWSHWASEQRRPTINGMIEEFNRLNETKGMKAVYTPVPFDDIRRKVIAAVAAGNPPDVVFASIEEVSIRAIRKQNQDITDYLPKDIAAKYYDNLFQTCLYNGRVYALPFNTDNRFLFYNKALFREAGITQMPKTWNDFLVMADKLDKKDASGNYSQYAFLPTLGNFGFDPFAYANGGFLFDDPMNPKAPTINSKQNVEALEYMFKWRQRYGKAYDVLARGDLNIGTNDQFMSGKVAVLGNVCNYIATLAKYVPNMDYGVAPLPPGPSATKSYTSGGGFVVEVPYGVKNVKEAAELVRFLADDWAATKWGVEQKDVMINKVAAAAPELNKAPAWSMVTQLLPATIVQRRLANAQTAGDIKNTWVNRVMQEGSIAPKEALENAQKEIEKLMKDNEALSK